MSPIKYLSQTEMITLFSVIIDARDRAMFATMYYYGLRVSEASLLLHEEVDFEHQTLFIRRVKNGIGGQFPLLTNTATLLRRYLPERDPVGDALFTGRQGRLSSRRIQQLFRQYAQPVGLEKYTPHSLRHSIATHLLDAGLDISYVQAHLGHARIESTKVYAQITDKRRLEAFQIIEQSESIVKL